MFEMPNSPFRPPRRRGPGTVAGDTGVAMTHWDGYRRERESFEVRDGLIEPARAADAPTEIIDWRERAAGPDPMRQQVRYQRAEPPPPRPRRRSSGGHLMLVGGGVTVGLVAIVAVWYAVSRSAEPSAHCVNQDSVLAEDERLCNTEYVRSHGGYHSGGVFFLPGGQYHYNYGGTVGPDRRVIGGTSAVQRGGLGGTSGGKSGGS
jgi:hypothetical protein